MQNANKFNSTKLVNDLLNCLCCQREGKNSNLDEGEQANDNNNNKTVSKNENRTVVSCIRYSSRKQLYQYTCFFFIKAEHQCSSLKERKKNLSETRPSKIIDVLAEEEEMINLTIEENTENNKSNNKTTNVDNDPPPQTGKFQFRV